MSTESEDDRIREIKKEGYGTQMGAAQVCRSNCGIAVSGGLVLLFAWLNHEPPPEPWKSDISNLILAALLYGMAIYYFYLHNMWKLERRIRWLEMMLRAVASRAERAGAFESHLCP